MLRMLLRLQTRLRGRYSAFQLSEKVMEMRIPVETLSSSFAYLDTDVGAKKAARENGD